MGPPQPVPVDNHPHSILPLDTTEVPRSDKSGSVCIGDSWHRLSENQQDLRSHLFPTHPEWTGRISTHLGLEQGVALCQRVLASRPSAVLKAGWVPHRYFPLLAAQLRKDIKVKSLPAVHGSLHRAKLFWPLCPFPGAKGYVSERSQPVPLVQSVQHLHTFATLLSHLSSGITVKSPQPWLHVEASPAHTHTHASHIPL